METLGGNKHSQKRKRCFLNSRHNHQNNGTSYGKEINFNKANHTLNVKAYETIVYIFISKPIFLFNLLLLNLRLSMSDQAVYKSIFVNELSIF